MWVDESLSAIEGCRVGAFVVGFALGDQELVSAWGGTGHQVYGSGEWARQFDVVA